MDVQEAIVSALTEMELEHEETSPGTFRSSLHIGGRDCPTYLHAVREQGLFVAFLYSAFDVRETHRAEVCQFLNHLNISPLMDIGCAELLPDGQVRYRAALILEDGHTSPESIARIVRDAHYCMERIQPKLPVVAASRGERIAMTLIDEMHGEAPPAREPENPEVPDEL